ncbi:MAG: DUF5119 domain-containing protein [Bacteroidales bacterium]|nr:DUF5119 domain-containing protein [Bacteroidales bacterium]
MAIGKMVKRLLIELVSRLTGKITAAGRSATAICKATALVAIVLLATSCTHKDLCMMHPHTVPMRINVDWSQFVEKETPSGMTVIVYPLDGGAPIFTRSNTISHVLVNLPEGRYNSIVFNQSETEFGTLELRNLNNYMEAEVVAIQAPTKWYTTKDRNERIVHEPEWFGTDNEENAEVTALMLEQGAKNIRQNTKNTKGGIDFIFHTAQNVIHTVNVTVHIKNIYNLRSARAALEGMAEGYRLGAGKPSTNKVTHLMENWSLTVDPQDPTQGTIKAQLLCFGLPDGHKATPQENIFNLSLLLVDNKTIVEYKFEVGHDFEEDDTAHLTLHLEMDLGDPLPDVKPEGGQGGGFDASVSDWGEEIEHEIEM